MPSESAISLKFTVSYWMFGRNMFGCICSMSQDRKITISKCGRCGGRHRGVAVIPFKKARGKWTHWTMCPKNGEPIEVAFESAKAEGL